MNISDTQYDIIREVGMFRKYKLQIDCKNQNFDLFWTDSSV